MTRDDDFESFVLRIEPGLRRALTGNLAPGAVADALAEAFAYAWEHRERVMAMDNPSGYLFRVAQSKARTRRHGWLPWSADAELPDIEPGLPIALRELSSHQAQAVWLVHACGWSYAETAIALDTSTSTVGTHVARALAHLRERLGVATHG